VMANPGLHPQNDVLQPSVEIRHFLTRDRGEARISGAGTVARFISR
jgi:hypothetical protein